jgi:DNA-3-methyladenine glycosylase
VLIRALEPLEGLELMRRRRGGVDDRRLCSGPGNLCQALGITRDLDGRVMPASPVIVLAPPSSGPQPAISATPRIGITKAADWMLRYHLEGNGFVSGAQRGKSAAGPRNPKPPSVSR